MVVSWFSVFVTYSQTPVPEGIIEVEIPVRGTFVRAMDDWPYYGPGQKEYDEYLDLAVGDYTDFRIEEPAIVNLESHGLFEGDTVYIGWSGGDYPDGAWDPADPGSRTMGLRENEKVPYGGLLGLFSTTSELKDIDVLNRVPGAIAFGDDFVTPETLWDGGRFEISQKLKEKNVDWYNGSLTTDIPEDFKIDPYTGMLIEIPRNAKFLFISLIDEYYRDNFESPNSLIATIEKDTDKDGIPDNWEINGIDINKDNEIDLDLPMLGADWEHKDVFVEIDYMGSSGAHDHKPQQTAINDVIQAFRNAPVNNPDNIQGINLHVIIDEELEHINQVTFNQFRTQIKTASFGTEEERSDRYTIAAKKMVFHYCLFAHLQTGGGWSGRGEVNGDDFMVSLGAFTDNTGTMKDQAATFMHELGHNLGLEHGGDEKINYKPNYTSIMNYLFQLDVYQTGRPLDFSDGINIPLTEASLNENIGIGDAVKTAWRLANGTVAKSPGTLHIDWNGDGNTTVGVSVNLNNFPQEPSTNNNETLTDYNDWENLFYRFKNTADFVAGEDSPHNELTFEEYEAMLEEAKNIVEVSSPAPTGFSELKVDVSALGTFLRADPIMEEGGSPVEEPTIIDLEATGILGENWIFITYSGKIFHAIDWGDGEPKEDGYINLIGLFSTTADLESIDKLNRVTGAIASNGGFVTDETYFGELSTDIPEDFLIGHHTGTTIEIPNGAKFLFLCNPDVYYPDNFGTFQVTIKKLETGQSDSVFPIEIVIIIILAIIIIIFMFLFYRRRKKRTEINE